MIRRVRQLVDDVHSAMQSRKVYGEDHATWRERLRHVVEALGRACGDAGEVRIVCIDGRVYWNDSSVMDASAPSPLGEAMRRAGLAWLVISKDAAEDELASFIRASADERDLSQVLSGLRGLRGGRAVASSENSGPPAELAGAVLSQFAIRTLCEEVEEGLEGALQNPVEAAKQVVGVVDRIAAVVASARTAMLPLASLKTHDEYTYVHTVNVGIMSAALAEAVGLRADQVHDIMLGAILHDIGKQLVPAEILNKGGKLSDVEAEVMRRHPVDGARVLLDVGELPDVVPIIAFEHHMHVNGGGYPKMARRWACNLAGQIVHVADVFDALRTNRPYRAALSTTEACGIMYRGAGSEFDGALLDAFFEHVAVRSERDSGATATRAA